MTHKTTEIQRQQRYKDNRDTKNTETAETTETKDTRENRDHCFMNDNRSCYLIISPDFMKL